MLHIVDYWLSRYSLTYKVDTTTVPWPGHFQEWLPTREEKAEEKQGREE